MNKALSRLLLFVQMILAAAFTFLIADLTMRWYEGRIVMDTVELVKLWSKGLVLFLALLINIMFRIRHRASNPEGELLPLIFLFMTLECSTLLPDYYVKTGMLLLDPIWINVIIRISLLYCSALFVFKSLTFFGSSNAQTGSMTVIALFMAIILAIIAPNDSLSTSAGRNFGSVYDAWFFIAIEVMNLASILTYIIVAVNDKTGHNIKRSITYTLLLTGNFGIFLYPSIETVIVMDVLFVSGAIMLLTRTKESYW